MTVVFPVILHWYDSTATAEHMEIMCRAKPKTVCNGKFYHIRRSHQFAPMRLLLFQLVTKQVSKSVISDWSWGAKNNPWISSVKRLSLLLPRKPSVLWALLMFSRSYWWPCDFILFDFYLKKKLPKRSRNIL